MSNKRQYQVEMLVPFKGWQPVSAKARNHLGVATDEYSAYVRTNGETNSIRLINTDNGRILRSHKRPTAVKEKAKENA
jgi:hypothetical protein